MKFNEFKLCPQILRALEAQGYKEPSPIQEKAIPPVLENRDLLGCAQTGSGKTAAFAVPILQKLYDKYNNNSTHDIIRSLILTPTRELAVQIQESFIAYGSGLNFKCGCILGGVSQKPQEKMLSDGVDILVATPGRLNDLISQHLVDLSNIEIFVLDEADRMLDMGFLNDVKKITSHIKTKKQTLLFSATMPPEIIELIDKMLRDYVKVAVDPISSTVDTITQQLYYVDTVNKVKLLVKLLEDNHVFSALVFTRTKHGADALVRKLSAYKVKAQAIHGNKSQNNRQNALNSFKNGGTQLLIATDIAARGIDIEGLEFVFNYDLPEDAAMYVHRIGRTGRAGASGTAISLCSFKEKPLLKDIEKLIGNNIPVIKENPYPMEDFTIPVDTRRNQPRISKSSATVSTMQNASHLRKSVDIQGDTHDSQIQRKATERGNTSFHSRRPRRQSRNQKQS